MNTLQPGHYRGTLDELIAINREIEELHEERAELARQEALLQEHRQHVIHLICLPGGKP